MECRFQVIIKKIPFCSIKIGGEFFQKKGSHEIYDVIFKSVKCKHHVYMTQYF